jgi:hypothetical protein
MYETCISPSVSIVVQEGRVLASPEVVSVRGGGGDSSRDGGVAGVAIEGAGYGGVCRLQPRTEGSPMTETSMPLIELLQKQDDGDFLRSVAEALLQLLMEHDVQGVVGAGRYERGEGRLTWRNGYRDRELKTRLGVLNLRVPKLRQGSYFPGFLEPRRTSEKPRHRCRRTPLPPGHQTRRRSRRTRARAASPRGASRSISGPSPPSGARSARRCSRTRNSARRAARPRCSAGHGAAGLPRIRQPRRLPA